MNRWKKFAAVAAIAAMSAGAGVAYAGGPDHSGAGITPPAQTSATKNLGTGVSETKFVPITPCRLVDTRQAGAGGPIQSGQARAYDVRGTGSTFAAQGGHANGCGIPSTGVTAVDVTVTAVGAAGNGFLRVYPSSEPTATFLNYTASFNPSNSGTVALCGADGGLCLINHDLVVKANTKATDVVIDVQGYYELPLAATVTASGGLSRNSRAIAVDHLGTGQYTVQFDRNVHDCAYVATIGVPIPGGNVNAQVSAQYDAASGFNDYVYVQTSNSAGSNADEPFTLEVIC